VSVQKISSQPVKKFKKFKGKIVSKAGLKPVEFLQKFSLNIFHKIRGKKSRVWFGALPDNDLLTAGAEERVCGAAASQPVRRGMKPKHRILSFNPSSLIIKGGAMVSDNWTGQVYWLVAYLLSVTALQKLIYLTHVWRRSLNMFFPSFLLWRQ
jgi:hypothetical protein